mmetsp:Transcript_66775/g.204361  ORF Transcript_66775/g.204361 Transcript_66775/m.204361 type:complete len:585 (-) Transcript_66775:314-2068(-)
MQHQLHRTRRVTHGLDLPDVLSRQGIQSREGILQRRHRLRQIGFHVGFLRLGLGGRFRRDRLIGRDDFLHLVRLLGLGVDLHHHLLDLRVLGHELRLQRDQLDLHPGHGLLGGQDLFHAVLVLVFQVRDLLPLLRQEHLERLDQLQERSRGRIADAFELLLEHLCQIGGGGVEQGAHRHATHPHRVLHLHAAEELLRHSRQRVRRPLGEPVDGAAIDQRRELAQARSPGVSDGREAEDGGEHLPAAIHEVRVQLRRCALRRLALLPRGGADHLAQLDALVRGEQVRDLTCVQKVVQILDEAFALDLRVGEQEHVLLALPAGVCQQLLHVLAEGGLVVPARDLDLVDHEVRQEARELGGALATAAADTDEQRVAPRGLDDARHAGQVLQHVQEAHQVHGLVGLLVVGGQVPLDLLLQHRYVGTLRVGPFGELGGREHVAKKERPHLVEGVHLAILVRIQVAAQLVEGGREDLLGLVPELRQHPPAISVVHEPVAEHAVDLVRPQADVAADPVALAFLQQHDAEHDLRKISQVEGVVDLHRGGEQLLRRVLVDLERGLHDLFGQRGNVARVILHTKSPIQYRREDL